MMSWQTVNKNDGYMFSWDKKKNTERFLWKHFPINIAHLSFQECSTFYSVYIDCDFLYIIQKENSSIGNFKDASMHILNMEVQ